MVSLSGIVKNFQLSEEFGQFGKFLKNKQDDPGVKKFFEDRDKKIRGEKNPFEWHLPSELIESASLPRNYIEQTSWEKYNLSFRHVFFRAGCGAILGVYALVPILEEYIFGNGTGDGIAQMLTPIVGGALFGFGWGTIQREMLEFQYLEERLLIHHEESYHN